MTLPYRMRTDNDCGPAALSAASGVPYEAIMAAWGGWAGNRTDSPWHHDRTMARLGIRREIIGCEDVLRGRALPDATVALIHSPDRPILVQHWVVVGVGGPSGVYIHMGDGATPRFVTADIWRRWYAGGTPACCYIVGCGDVPKLSWYQRLYCWLTSIGGE